MDFKNYTKDEIPEDFEDKDFVTVSRSPEDDDCLVVQKYRNNEPVGEPIGDERLMQDHYLTIRLKHRKSIMNVMETMRRWLRLSMRGFKMLTPLRNSITTIMMLMVIMMAKSM